MDSYEPTKIVFSRVQALEPGNVSKIMGYLLLQDHGNQEMMRLAFGPDSLLQSAISKIKKELDVASYRGLHLSSNLMASEQFPLEVSPHSPAPLQPSCEVLPQFSMLSSHVLPQYLSPTAVSPASQLQSENPYLVQARPWLSPLYIPDTHPYLQFSPSSSWENGSKGEGSPNSISLHQSQSVANVFLPSSRSQKLQEVLEEQQDLLASEQYCQISSSPLNSKATSNKFTNRFDVLSSDGLSSLAWKPCLYFARGFCKHGSSCRFLHGSLKEESASSSPSSEPRDLYGVDGSQSRALERLELELQELLRGRRTPISIASLPQLYYERFGKTLQASGYLTESQRHGKAGYSLTKLLARLRNSVTLIDRPHGQHAVVLAEDAQNYTFKGEQEELKAASSSSRQIYLTFPAESNFTEEDVSLHFRAYGPVQDVRIPYQQRRMFGFVTFAYPETVKHILSEGNPHYICGARVLVKPYREKSKSHDRKHSSESLFYTLHRSSSSSGSNDFNAQALAAFSNDSYLRKLQEENVMELERKLGELHLEDTRRLQLENEAVAMLHNGAHSSLKRSYSGVSYKAEIGPYSSDSHENVYIAEPTTVNPAAAHIGHGIVANNLSMSDELSLPTDDMVQFQSNDPFDYLLDVLESDAVEDAKGLAAKKGHEVVNNGHNLPESPFSSPQTSTEELLPPLDAFGFDTNSQIGMSLAQKIHALNNFTCSICSDYFIDPIRLDCSHIFCLQCILKVVKSSKDECPVCQKHIGSQVYKIFQNIDRQSWLSLEQSQSAAQQIW